jgi:hypothetical protein
VKLWENVIIDAKNVEKNGSVIFPISQIINIMKKFFSKDHIAMLGVQVVTLKNELK